MQARSAGSVSINGGNISRNGGNISRNGGRPAGRLARAPPQSAPDTTKSRDEYAKQQKCVRTCDVLSL
eukprot:3937418-Rhodomonas_salina.2